MMRLFLIATLALVPVSHASQDDDGPHAEASLIAEKSAVVPGKTFFLGLHLDIEDHWHVYWNGLNDTGYPIELELEVPAGYEVGEILWPAPYRYISGDDELLDHVYHDAVTLIVPIKAPTDAGSAQSVTITGSAGWLICKELCMFESADDLELTLPVTAFVRPGPDASRFAKARDRLPKNIEPIDGVQLKRAGASLEVFVSGASSVAFYPADDCPTPTDLIAQGLSRGPRLNVEFEPDEAEHAPIRGVLEVFAQGTTGYRSRVFTVDLPAS